MMPLLQEIRNSQSNKIGLASLLSGLVTFSVFITLTILLIASYQSKKQALYETTLSLNYTNAAKMSQTMDSLFKSMRSSLQYSSGILANYSTLNGEELFRTLELMRYSSNNFNSIFIVDETGMIRSRTPYEDGATGRIVTTAAVQEALALREPYLSHSYTSSIKNRLVVFMSEPLFDNDGTYRGIIGGTIFLQENNIMNMIFGSNNVDDAGSSFYVVGSDGRLLYHPVRTRIGEDISANTVVKKLMQGESGQEQIVNLGGVHQLTGYATVPENGWGVVVVTPLDAFKGQLTHHIQTLLVYTLLPFIALLLSAIWLARKLASPFVALAGLVSKIGREDVLLPEMKNHWNREADLLTKTIVVALTDIRRQTEQLTRDAMTDPLTGLTNRRTLESIMNKWTAEQVSFSIIVMDIDRFKKINDTYGHQTGDEVLTQLAAIVTASVRPGDICCRYGGEEFVVLLALAAAEDAFLVAEKIRKTLETSDNKMGERITISLGIAHYPSHSASAETLFQLADQALYKAKENGRNRTIVADIAVSAPARITKA
jgi:diguanylate cyclase (GGDEF)-like protein